MFSSCVTQEVAPVVEIADKTVTLPGSVQSPKKAEMVAEIVARMATLPGSALIPGNLRELAELVIRKDTSPRNVLRMKVCNLTNFCRLELPVALI